MQKKPALLYFLFLALVFLTEGFSLLPEEKPNYTVITYDYHQVIKQSEEDIRSLINQIKPYENKPGYLNQLVLLSVNYFTNRPYDGKGVEGEGNWQPGNIAIHGAPHIQQDPIYRTDRFVCSTLTQIILALVRADNLENYHKNILTIKYGAAHEPPSNIHYYNRNHFISGDFNPINEKNGLLENVTHQGIFAKFSKETSATIDREKWFHHQLKPPLLEKTIRVLSEKEGTTMAERTQDHYPEKFHHFIPEKVSIDYIPKQALTKVVLTSTGEKNYEANEERINQIPVPALIEIVRDVQQWKIGNHNITEVIGSGINVSHVGLLYRQHFKKGEVIYQQINCIKKNNQKICTLNPVVCKAEKGCTKMMLANATESYPDTYHYYQDNQGAYRCDKNPPPAGTLSVSCNRVMALPLGDYLTTYQYGRYPFMSEPSILGIHVEKILDVDLKKHFR